MFSLAILLLTFLISVWGNGHLYVRTKHLIIFSGFEIRYYVINNCGCRWSYSSEICDQPGKISCSHLVFEHDL